VARPGREARTSGSECQRVNHYATEPQLKWTTAVRCWCWRRSRRAER